MGFKMVERHSTILRVLSVVAGTMVSMACGTNYAFSAWAPQYCKRLILSSTDSNLIGTSANFGMYLSGIPVGILVDTKGPRVGALLGAALIGTGYFGLYEAYVAGPGSVPLVGLCIFSGLTGIGGAAAFFGAIKTATMNWPTHRGSATAFPLAGFGLSAFLFSLIAGLAFNNNVAGLLLLFTVGTFLIIVLSTWFLQIVPMATPYASVPSTPDPEIDGRDASIQGRHQGRMSERTPYVPISPGYLEASSAKDPQSRLLRDAGSVEPVNSIKNFEPSPARSSSFSHEAVIERDSIYDNVRGIRMLKHGEFYELFILMGIMTGTGLMTINNIGNDAQALWSAWDDAATTNSIEKHQKAYVSIISLASFVGRLLSGIGSDYISMKLGKSRFWCLFASSLLFCFAQLIAILVENPNLLVVLSGCTGLAYGVLFGVMPALVAETFGSSGISQNWGFMTLSPIIFGNIFNIFYGRVYDEHSRTTSSGHLECLIGRFCYKDAYWLTFAASVAAMFIILGSIWHRQKTQKALSYGPDSDGEHLE